jgi:hypothetical protein
VCCGPTRILATLRRIRLTHWWAQRVWRRSRPATTGPFSTRCARTSSTSIPPWTARFATADTWRRSADRERWERRYAEEQEEIAALREALGVTTHRVARNRAKRDNEKMGYGHTAGRVQNQIARRVRNIDRHGRTARETYRRSAPHGRRPSRWTRWGCWAAGTWTSPSPTWSQHHRREKACPASATISPHSPPSWSGSRICWAHSRKPMGRPPPGSSPRTPGNQ